MGDGQFTYHSPNLNETTLGMLHYAGTDTVPANAPAPDPMAPVDGYTVFTPADAEDAPPPTVAQHVKFNGQYTADNQRWMFFNDSAWTPLAAGSNALSLAVSGSQNASISAANYLTLSIGDQLNFVNPTAGVMDLVLNNLDDGDHPFHLHGHKFWVLSQGRNHYYGDTSTLDTTNPMVRDTVMVQNLGHVVIRFRTDNPGIWAFHCHIGWHMMSGLLLTVTDLPDEIAKFQIPDSITGLCPAEAQWRTAANVSNSD
jgi:iron transport multicopper oxidase